jgi:hypothetical protein
MRETSSSHAVTKPALFLDDWLKKIEAAPNLLEGCRSSSSCDL